MLLRRLSALLLLLAATGCPAPSPSRCAYAGDAGAPIAAALFGLDGAQSFAPLLDGGTLLISSAPQGGYIFYAGALATNLDECNVTLSAELIDPASGEALTNLDQRQSNFDQLVDGFSAPADYRSDLPNIPACPDALGRGVIGQPSILRVTIVDQEGKRGVFSQAVRAVCPPDDTSCPCVCGPSGHGC